eukprot:scaffold8728_cov105-Isochrysis_galbana.AAC.1
MAPSMFTQTVSISISLRGDSGEYTGTGKSWSESWSEGGEGGSDGGGGEALMATGTTIRGGRNRNSPQAPSKLLLGHFGLSGIGVEELQHERRGAQGGKSTNFCGPCAVSGQRHSQ